MTIEELQVLITANTTALQKEIAKTNSKISSLKKSAEKTQKGVTSAFSKLRNGIVALGIGKIISESIQTGMDSIETESKFNTVLGDIADEVNSWATEVSNSLGLNLTSMQNNISTIYSMSSALGVAGDNALTMSKGVSVLAEDMASFYNMDSSETFNKLRAGLTGETEPLKALGILVDENTIKQYAYAEGIAETGAELTNEQKVLARYVAILAQTSDAQGDLARTLDSPANQVRILKNQVTNLAKAFSNLLMPVVSAVLPYINAFVKVITSAVNSLATFLGLVGSSDKTNSLGDVSVSAGDTSEQLDNASESAKKLKKNLAGFDEMNVITDNSSDSGSSGSSGVSSGTGFDLSEYETNLSSLSGKTNEIVAQIQSAFSKVGEGIDFNNLITSFQNLKTALEPITQTLFSGLNWAYNTLLLPLAQWTIGEFVPAFLNAVSGALTVLNPVLTAFQTPGIWLWESFLQPIATWTGGLIVDTLNGVGTGLTTIGEWASANQETIDKMVATFATFFGLWKLTEIMAFIQMSGGLVGAIGAITTATWGTVTAKLADKAETIALTALYAKDFLVSIVKGTGALLKQAGQWAITTGLKIADKVATIAHTVATVAGTVATTAFNVAMAILTSPITLVVLAIGALIAIIVLCVKNWNTIKTTAISVANAIREKVVSAFTKVKEKMSEIWEGIWSTIKGVINSIIGGIESMINTVIKGLNKIITPLTKIGNTILEAIGIKSFSFTAIKEVTLPRLARGGIVDSPTYAMIGEAGAEAVMPLENNTGWIDQLAEKINARGNGGSPIQVVVKLGEETIYDKFIDYVNDKNFQSNGEVFAL